MSKDSPQFSVEASSPAAQTAGASSQPMWFEEIEYVELEKGDRGLGFSILDYQVLICIFKDLFLILDSGLTVI